MLLEDRLHLVVVAAARDDHAAGAHHRLGDEGRDGLRPFPLDHGFQRCGHAVGEILLALAFQALPPVVRAIGVQHPLEGQVEGLVVERNTGEAPGRRGDAVVGAEARDDLLLLGPAAQVVVVADQLELRVVPVRARESEEHLADVVAIGVLVKQRKQLLGESDLRLVGSAAEGVEEADARHLLGRDLGEPGPPVADVDAPERRRSVDKALALPVVDLHPAALPVDDGTDILMLGDRGDRVEHDLLVELLQGDVLGLIERHAASPMFEGGQAAAMVGPDGSRGRQAYVSAPLAATVRATRDRVSPQAPK